MALAMKIGKSAWEKLPDDVKKEYKESGSDYTLDLTGYEDPTEIKRAKDNEVREHSGTKKERDTLKAENEALKKEGGDTTKALDELRTSLTEKHTADLAAATGVTDSIRKKFETTEANRIANEIAKEISSVPSLLAPKIAERVSVEWDKDHTPTVFIKGADGKRSAMTQGDLSKEFSTNKEFAAIIVATKANGGNRVPPSNSSGRAGNFTNSPQDKPDDLSKMNSRDLADRIKADKESAGS